MRTHTYIYGESILWAHCGSAECWQTNFKLDLLPIDDEMQPERESEQPLWLSAGREERRNWRWLCAHFWMKLRRPKQMFGKPLTGGFCRPDRDFDGRAICEQTHRWTLFEAHDEPFEIAPTRDGRNLKWDRRKGFVASGLKIVNGKWTLRHSSGEKIHTE